MSEQMKRSQAQERRAAAKYGGTTNSGSGNGWMRKNDVRANGLLFEHKRTDNNRQITIKKSDLDGVRHNAILEGRVPIFAIEMAGDHFVILREEDFDDFLANGSLADSGVRKCSCSSRPPPG